VRWGGGSLRVKRGTRGWEGEGQGQEHNFARGDLGREGKLERNQESAIVTATQAVGKKEIKKLGDEGVAFRHLRPPTVRFLPLERLVSVRNCEGRKAWRSSRGAMTGRLPCPGGNAEGGVEGQNHLSPLKNGKGRKRGERYEK